MDKTGSKGILVEPPHPVRRVGAGAWLGAVRTRLQTMCRNGENVTWGSDDVLEPSLTVRQVEELAALAVEADRLDGSREDMSECAAYFEEKQNMSRRPELSKLSPSSIRKTGRPSGFVTNFQRFDEPLYRKLLGMFPDKGLRIEDPAYDVFGREVPSMLALHRDGGERDLSDFWAAYEKLLVQKVD